MKFGLGPSEAQCASMSAACSQSVSSPRRAYRTWTGRTRRVSDACSLFVLVGCGSQWE